MTSVLHSTTEVHYRALARWLAAQAQSRSCPVFGINGAQGTGKTTLAFFLREALNESHGLRAALLSLDDCYLGREARRALATTIHPLLQTRGAPGTHDTELGATLLQRLRTALCQGRR
jgi:D-glycerate 3-kinase